MMGRISPQSVIMPRAGEVGWVATHKTNVVEATLTVVGVGVDGVEEGQREKSTWAPHQ